MKKITGLFLSIIFMTACTDSHFISDENYRNNVKLKFEKRKEFAKNRSKQLFSVFDQNISTKEREALEFLYAYMPLCDLADYNGEFFLKQVQYSFKTKKTFSWGNKIPEDVFRHFVLPYRVNNENLDTGRMVFFYELKDRIKHLSMKEAALEVNHWCHEKVNYAPADIRTSSPLATVKTSHGRCGEESTFTVTAMRAVGIPARQVYTPRWAHCDDNHAWVEVWIDGQWYFLGACEPEPDLNMAWFTEPVRRAMLVHTKVFGAYDAKDEVTLKSDNFSEINVVSIYADVNNLNIKVVDEQNNAVKGAKVDFGLYNYAEFYPIASIYSDENGISSLTTGYGDLLIWASKDGKFAYQKVSNGQNNKIILKLGSQVLPAKEDYIFTPPLEKTPYPVDESKKKENDIRLAKEDSIRNAYKAGFITEEIAHKVAEGSNLDKVKTWKYLKLSEGNWVEIKKYMEYLEDNEKQTGFELLEQISHKDLRDVRVEVLYDHLHTCIKTTDPANYQNINLFNKYVLNPRVKNENLTAYRKFFYEKFKSFITKDRNKTVRILKRWISDNVIINESENYYNLPVMPIGVYELKVSNAESRNILFVSLCRSIGIPARLEQASKKPQYFDGKEWLFVSFGQTTNAYTPPTGTISLIKKNVAGDFDPAYRIHFSIAKLNKGIYETLDYGWETKLSQFDKNIKLETGNYRLLTAMRAADGSVFTKMKHFSVQKNQHLNIKLEFRDPVKEMKPIGSIDLKNTLTLNDKKVKLNTIFKKDFSVLIWVEPGKEPTRHLMEEFAPVKEKYEKWGGEIAVIKADQIKRSAINKEFLKNIPKNYHVYDDHLNILLNQFKNELKIEGKVVLPLVIVLDKQGNIYIASRGYKIGIHEQILKLIQ